MGWLGAFAGESNGRRLLIALALSVAIHEVAMALLPPVLPPPGEPKRAATQIALLQIKRRPQPTPTPTPQPQPTPVAIVHTRVIAPVATPVPVHQTPGKAAHAERIHHQGAARPKPPHLTPATPIPQVVPTGGQGAGAGHAAGAGSLGHGGSQGTGSGASGTGSGGGGQQPCGYVVFINRNGLSLYDKQTGGFFVNIKMEVHFPDGRMAAVNLDYPWYYPNQAENPWSRQNLDNPDFPVTFQSPPPGKRSGQPPLVQYVMAHSTAHGFTLLRQCPKAHI
ncbi:MAG: hypothetical protein ACYDA5_07915 [Vulcanimicrobiaceae bacterium]